MATLNPGHAVVGTSSPAGTHTHTLWKTNVLELDYIEDEDKDITSNFLISEEMDIFTLASAAQPAGPAVLPLGKGSGTPAPTPSTLNILDV